METIVSNTFFTFDFNRSFFYLKNLKTFEDCNVIFEWFIQESLERRVNLFILEMLVGWYRHIDSCLLEKIWKAFEDF